MKTLLYIARNLVLAILLYLLQAWTPVLAQSVVYTGDITPLGVVEEPGDYTYQWELYDDGAVDFSIVPGNCPVTSAIFIGANTGATVNVQWLKAGIYYFKAIVWDITGCVKNFKIGMIEVKESLPKAVITPPDPAGICAGVTAELEVTITGRSPWNFVYTDGTNSWTVTGITESPYILKVTPLGTTTYWISEVSNDVGTNSEPSEAVTQKVIPLPILVTTNPPAVCYPETIDLTDPLIITGSDADLLYEYYSDAEASNAIPDPKVIKNSGTYYIKATNLITNCYTIKPVGITINPLPLLVITDPPAVCQPGKVDLTKPEITAGSEAGLVYEYLVDTLANIQIPDPKAVTVSGIYFIRATNPITSCIKIKPVTVAINPQPILVITDPPAECFPTTIDLTKTIDIAGSIIPASTAFGYYTNAAATIPVANANAVGASGTYYIKAIAPGGCPSDVVSVKVTINPQPKLVITDPAAACEPATVNLKSPAVTSGSDAGLTYEYYSDADATEVLSNPTAIDASGTYYIKAINTITTCSIIKPVEVVVNPLLTPEFTSVNELCVNENTPSLPKISNNGIPGTSSPSSISSATAGVTTYTFTPSPTVCAKTVSIDVKVNPPANPKFNPIGPFCQNIPAPGLPPVSNNGYTGTWNPATISTSATGSFSYRFTPFAGLCAKDTTIIIVVEPEVITVFGPIGPFCLNSEAPPLPTTDNNGLTGTWSPAIISTTNSGVFDYVFTPDGVNCVNIKPTKIQITDPIVLTETHQNIGYSIQPIGSIDLTVNGGYGGFTYLWSNGETSQDLTGLDKGTYTVVVTDENKCTATLEVTITRIELMTMTAVPHDACPGFSGSIDFTFTNVPDGTYDIFYTGGKFPNVPVLDGEASVTATPGTYNNLKLYFNGNPTINEVNIGIVTLPAITLKATPFRGECSNLMGTIEFKFTNVPTGLYDITYDGGQFTGVQVISNVAKVPAIAKTYTNLMLTMGTGCSTNMETVTLDPPVGITPVVDPPVQPTCAIPTGTIVVTSPSGPNFSYSNDGGNTWQDSETFTGLLPSTTHQIKTRDKITGCESEITQVSIFSVPSDPDFATVSITSPSCDIPTGSFTITNASFGTGYEYSVDGINYQDSKTFNGLTPDQTYQLRVRLKSTGCESLTSIPIPPLPPLPAAPTASITSQPDCMTKTTGSIVVSSPSFNSGYVYSKDGGITYQDSTIFRNLLPGKYQIRVKSKISVSELCSSNILELTILNPLPPEKPIAAITQPNCTDTLGIITVSAPVGADITYSINGSGFDYSSGIFKDLAAGDYVVSAKNSGGCISEPSEKITIHQQPETPIAPIAEVTQPDCKIPTGTIAVSSALTGLNFSIDGVDYTNTSGIFSGLAPGDYFVTARNVDGCVSPNSVKYTVNAQPLIPAAPTSSVKQPDCSSATGTITVTSATAGLHFSIDGVDYTNTSGIFTGLTPGDYFVTARISVGCGSMASQKLTVNPQPAVPDVPTVSVIQPDCSNSSGTITITSETAGLLFSIDGINYSSTTVYSGLTPKDYFVTAKNSVGCISLPAFKVTIKAQPATPIAPQAIPVAAECEQDPIQKIYARSGIAALPSGITLNWYNDQGVTVIDPFLNAVGSVTYYAESTNGSCVSISRTAVTLSINAAPKVLVSQNPVEECAEKQEKTLDANDYASVEAGNQLFWWDAATGGKKVDKPILKKEGTLIYYAEAFNGQCSSTPRTAITLTINPLPAAPQVKVTANPTCNFPNGTVVVTSPKEGIGFEYNIDGGNYQSSATFPLLKWGDHLVRIRQIGTGCESLATLVTIDAIPPAPVLTVATIENCTCYGGNGAINFTVTNAKNGVYKITYDGGTFDNVSVQGGAAKVVAAAGTYTNLTIDANGCTSEPLPTVTVTEPSLIALTETVTEIDLKSGRKGAIDLHVNGGTASYSYLWSNGATTEDIKDLVDGSYTVIVTDNNGCKQPKTITIPIPNFSPVATDDAYSVGCDLISGNLIINDSDPEKDPFYLDPSPVEQPLHGSLTLKADGTFEYQPDLRFSGTDYFSYAIYDTKHYLGDTAKVTLTIIGDFDCDGTPNEVDIDTDGDGILNVTEGGLSDDSDGDGIPNYLDIDSDNDGIVDNVESQSSKDYIHPLSMDTDGDGLDDAYDPDQKGKTTIPVDTDKDGIPDYLDADSDDDLVPDYIEGHDFNSDGMADYIKIGKDLDTDGLDDVYDTVNRYTTSGNMTGSNAAMQDLDGDGLRDWRDDNDDNDEYLTRFEDLNADGDYSNDDIDHDGLPEYLDYGRDCDLFVPNIFTPNNDNIHDYFVIYCINHYPNAKILIFDQNGNEIYKKEHYGNLEYWGSVSQAWWNGTNMFSGNKDFVPVGTYYYVLILGNGEVKKSYVFISY